MAQPSKVIISCAVTGSVHTPSMTPYLPITADEIAQSSIEAWEAGASVLHLHARNEENGMPTPDPAAFMKFLPRIKQSTDAIVNITTGGGANMSLDERIAAALYTKPEMASLNMGSMNFGIFGAGANINEWKYDWEKPFLERTYDFIFKNTFADIEGILKRLGEGCGTRFEFECYDIGHLYTLAHFADRGLVKPPFFIQNIFGILGGMGADYENLDHMRRMANKLFGDDYRWSVLAAGRHQMPFVTMAALKGGNVRVGLEDSIYEKRGTLAKTNAVQVAKIRRILEELGMEIATPAEARAILDLKGADQVGF